MKDGIYRNLGPMALRVNVPEIRVTIDSMLSFAKETDNVNNKSGRTRQIAMDSNSVAQSLVIGVMTVIL
jgi:hypothetical protein